MSPIKLSVFVLSLTFFSLFLLYFYQAKPNIPEHFQTLNAAYTAFENQQVEKISVSVGESHTWEQQRWQEIKTKLQGIRMHNVMRNRYSNSHVTKQYAVPSLRHPALLYQSNPRIWTSVD